MSRWRGRAGVRTQATAIATLAVALATVLGGVVFLFVLHHNLRTDVDLAVRQQATTLAATIARKGAADVDLAGNLGDTNVIQLVDGQGSVVSSSSELRGYPALTTARPPVGRFAFVSRRLRLDSDAHYRQAALGVRDAQGRRYTLIVAQSLESADASSRITTGLLAVSIPLLLVLVAGVTYAMSGRALRPVERMRAQLAAIDAQSLGARVPVPEAKDEIWKLAGTMNLMLDRLESAATSQRQFVSDASHELRSPLATIRTSVEVTVAHPEAAQWLTMSEVVLEEAARLEHLVADLLLLASADERGPQLRRTDVDLDDLVASEVDRLRATTTVTVVRQVQAVRVSGDRQRLARVLRNLADNAARHAHSTVTFSLSSRDGQAVIEIRDDGDGIPDAERERVFERFVRLDDGRSRSQGGTGLGLAIVRQLVQAHGGSVAVVPTPGLTVFRVVLPLGGGVS
ncbi:MAG: hypothetical protein JWO12_3437 [Frankiales bacterium]|nr:hypothetical protein [Frankiales bacterium]